MKKIMWCLLITMVLGSFFASAKLDANEEEYVFSLKWGSYICVNAVFSSVAVDNSDNVYAIDAKNCRVQKFDNQVLFAAIKGIGLIAIKCLV